MMLLNLARKNVLITGAASGIGLETALAFARCGARLLLVDVKAQALEVAARAVAQIGADCHFWVADVTDEAAMTALAEDVHNRYGALDVLVNNAGIAFIGGFLETPPARWRRVLDVNVMGVVNGCQAFLPRMRKSGGVRRVVNVASAAGLTPAYNLSAYSASKHAVVGLSDTLAMELDGCQTGVTVVCPGIIDTPIATPSRSNVGASITPLQLNRVARFYRTQGAHPRVVADAIVHAVRRGRGLVLVGPYASLVYHLRRFSRSLLMVAMIADTRRKFGFE